MTHTSHDKRLKEFARKFERWRAAFGGLCRSCDQLPDVRSGITVLISGGSGCFCNYKVLPYNSMYKRNTDLHLLKSTFFLWGPRQVGKTSLLRSDLQNAVWIDLLMSENFAKFQAYPERLREELLQIKDVRQKWIIIDEIQKVPGLLNEVHWLIENHKIKFALCGSSARKLKRGHANLLGGRALRRELLPLTAHELGKDFNLEKAVNRGLLPNHYLNDNYQDRLRSYCSDYLKEEIFAEGLVRNLPAFSSFLSVAAFSDTEQTDFKNIASDVGVSAPTIRSYFEILEDTLIGRFLPAFRKRPKRRIQVSPKFYYFDVGVTNSLAKRGYIAPGSELFGKAFESWVFHELCAYRAYRRPETDYTYWRLSGGAEVDFIVNDLELAIEVKSSQNIVDKHLKGLRELKTEHPKLRRRLVVSCEKNSRKTGDNIEILSTEDFIRLLWSEAFF